MMLLQTIERSYKLGREFIKQIITLGSSDGEH